MLNNKKNEKAAVAQKIIDFENWQSNTSRNLSEKQTGTRRQLKLEPITLYESMCFKNSDDVEKSPERDQACTSDVQKTTQIDKGGGHDNNTIDSNSEPTSHIDNSKLNGVNQRMTPRKTVNNSGTQHKRNTGMETASVEMTSETESGQNSTKRPVRQFLKKGDGLKQRFKVDPNAYKLDNLPKYKYSGAHPNLRSKETVKPLKLQKDSQSVSSSAGPSSAKSNQKKVVEPLNQEKNIISSNMKDSQENQFQNALVFSKNVCSSTPDTKSSGYGSADPKNVENFLQTVVGNQQVLKLHILNANGSLQQPLRHQKIQSPTGSGEVPPPSPTDVGKESDDENEKSATATNVQGGSTTLSFAHTVDQTQDEMDTLNMFEYLEQKVKENNLEVDSSFINRIWKRAANADKPQSYDELDDESTDVKDNASQKGTESSIHTESNSDFYTTDDDGNTSAAEKLDHDPSADTEAESSLCLSNIVSGRSDDKNLDNVSTAGDAARNQSANSESEKTKDNTVLEHFREVLFSLLNQRATQAENDLQEQDVLDHITVKVNPDQHMVGGENNSISIESVHLPDDINNVKIRNDELEQEVINFKEANKKLTKMKQVFELEKSMFEQERQDTLKEMHDLKIKFEMYMHDERVKLEEEKRKMEQQLRTQRLTKQNKDRIAVLQLKDEVEKLNMQLKQKEQNHTAAQARLRAQLAKMERDQKILLDEMEQLKKENKRLEAECMRIEREKNNKLLDEINKNIAKLAPKMVLNEVSVTSPAIAQNSSDIVDKIKNPSFKRLFMKHRRIKSPDLKKTKGKCLGPPINTPTCRSSSDDEKAVANTQKENCSPESDHRQEELEPVTPPKEYADKMSHICPTTLCRATSTTGIQEKPLEEKKEDKKSVSASTSTEFNREIINPDGSKDIWYSNGNIKKLSADRMHIKMLYFNKDIKETDIEKGTIRYYYASTNTWHTTYLDGLEILEFPNGQTEHRLKNGVIETHFPNHSIKIVDPHNKEVESEWHFEDGTKLKHMLNGDKVLILSNGQREIHTKMCKRREYPDGTVKIVYPDGSQETRYSNGRVRLKDRDGKLIMDSDNAVRY